MAIIPSFSPGVLSAILLCLLPIAYKTLSGNRSRKNLPPGPPKKPLIGNLFDIPRLSPWYTFSDWKRRYGNIVSVEALGRGIVVLNSIEAVEDLLVNRAMSFSDRPTFVMIGELIGLDNSLPLLPYDTALKKQRKLCHAALSIEAVRKYHDIQQDASVLFLYSILEKPSQFMDQLRLTAGRIIMSVTYGISLNTPDDDYITEAEETMEMISKSTVPGAHLVDLVPALKRIPPWVPFNNIPKTANAGRKLLFSMVTRPFQYAKREMRPCFVRDCLDKFDAAVGSSTISKEEQDHLILWAAGSMYGAGGESTYASILSFIIAMARFPAVQKKIQDEIDAVVGRERLPTVSDQPSMPYVNAAVKEVLRWRPALPCGIARRTKRDEEYKGFWIPEGTIVIPNVWEISKDNITGIPTSDFAPERFLRENPALDPEVYAFGFGRRVCPGRYLGSNNLFLLVSGLMATVNIEAKGELDPSYSGGLVSYAEAFEVSFIPRSNEIAAFVKERATHVNRS
ncbi:hypothetical protein PM082_004889 [Marasmius tenuissimus]|nr:hypothetical protein PM082_004889 [Marasmius tenuissimus]